MHQTSQLVSRVCRQSERFADTILQVRKAVCRSILPIIETKN